MKNLLTQPSSKVKLNVGGINFETTTQTLSNVPDTILALMFGSKINLNMDESGSLFIDRDG